MFFEKFNQPVAPFRTFLKRIGLAFSLGFLIIFVALAIGMFGYHFFEGMSLVDSFLNASMILSSMGPAAPLVTPAGKIFAGFYALFSGLIFITIAGVMFSPVVHRFMHKWHMD